MPITSDHKDLFRTPTTEDKLTLFQSLLDTNELTVHLSLALLKIIHGELKNNKNHNRTIYKRYAKSIEAMRYHMLDMLQLVVATWKNLQARSTAPAEWFHDDNQNDQ